MKAIALLESGSLPPQWMDLASITRHCPIGEGTNLQTFRQLDWHLLPGLRHAKVGTKHQSSERRELSGIPPAACFTEVAERDEGRVGVGHGDVPVEQLSWCTLRPLQQGRHLFSHNVGIRDHLEIPNSKVFTEQLGHLQLKEQGVTPRRGLAAEVNEGFASSQTCRSLSRQATAY